jgi:hypothetical protein
MRRASPGPCLWVLVGGVLAGCSRAPSGGGPLSGVGGGPPASQTRTAPPPRPAEPFTHPLLAEASVKMVHEDCSRQALTRVVERIRITTVQATPPRARAPRKAGPTPGAPACRSPAIEQLGTFVRQQLVQRVGACVAQDGPLDAEWDMAHSSVLSLAVCLDCAQPAEEQAARCQRTLDALERIRKSLAASPRR